MNTKVATTTAIATPTPSACRHVNLLRLAVVCASSVPSAVILGPQIVRDREQSFVDLCLTRHGRPVHRAARGSRPGGLRSRRRASRAARRDAERRGDRRACADSGAAAPIALRARGSGDPLVRGEAHRLPAQRQNMDHLPRREHGSHQETRHRRRSSALRGSMQIPATSSSALSERGGSDGTRTRDLRRDRPAF